MRRLLKDWGSVRDTIRRIGLPLLGALLTQVVGKGVQVWGIGYASACLGPEAYGISGNVLVMVMLVQLGLDLGLEIVGIRKVASRKETLEDVAAALFTVRVLTSTVGMLVWMGVILMWQMDASVRWIWVLGGVHLWFSGLIYNWFFQSIHKVFWLSIVQLANSVGVSLIFLTTFKPGQNVGSDLWVVMGVNALVTLMVWEVIRRYCGVPLFRWSSLDRVRGMLGEGQANWCFNLSYTVLSSMNLPICFWLLGEATAGHYRAAWQLATTLQVFLSYFAFMLNPRIVRWHQDFEESKVNRRLMTMAIGVVLVGGVAVVILGEWKESIILMINREKYLPAAQVLPPLCLSKFFALSSGILIWGLFARRKDWWAVFACVPAIMGVLLGDFFLLNSGDSRSLLWAGWLTCLGEGLLWVGSWVAFLRSWNYRKN